uniref:CSON013128 protein n=1 Tax=Culicoides sonorensis TaxID=179676 RepID=A0A336KNS8_CULSO
MLTAYRRCTDERWHRMMYTRDRRIDPKGNAYTVHFNKKTEFDHIFGLYSSMTFAVFEVNPAISKIRPSSGPKLSKARFGFDRPKTM